MALEPLLIVPFVIVGVIIGLVSFIFWILMLADCLYRDFKTKLTWLLLLTFIPFA